MPEAKIVRVMRVLNSEQGEHGVTVTVAAQEGRHAIVVPREATHQFVDALQQLESTGRMSAPRQLTVRGHVPARGSDGRAVLRLLTDVGDLALNFPPDALASLITSLEQIRDDELPPFGH